MKGKSLVLILLVVFFAACKSLMIVDHEETAMDAVRRRAYARAVRCADIKHPRLAYDQLQWEVVPGDVFIVPASNGAVRVVAYYELPTHRVRVASRYRLNEIVYTHELVHALTATTGHPQFPFITCHLMYEDLGR